MKRILTFLTGLFCASLIALAQGQWEQTGVYPYGTGGSTSGGVRTDNSYSNGRFNSEMKANDGSYTYFRKGTFSLPAKIYRRGQRIDVSMTLSLKVHRGSGKPTGTAGAILISGKAGSGTSVPSTISLRGTGEQSRTVILTVPSSGERFSIVYECLGMKVVFVYDWVPDEVPEPVVSVEETAILAEEPVETDFDPFYGGEEPPGDYDEPVFAEEPPFENEEPVNEAFLPETVTEDTPAPLKSVVAAPKQEEEGITLLGITLSRKELYLYGGGAVLGLIIIILLIILICKKGNPEAKAAQKAAKAEAKAAAAAAKEQARAEAKAAAEAAAEVRKAEAAKKAEEAKAAAEARKAEQAKKAEEAKAAAEARKAEQAKKAEEAKAAAEARKAEQAKKAEEAKAAAEARKAEQAKKAAEAKAAAEARKAEQAKKAEEAKAAAEAKKVAEEAKKAAEKPAEKPADKPAHRFCEECGAPLAEDAVFCENCGHKVS